TSVSARTLPRDRQNTTSPSKRVQTGAMQRAQATCAALATLVASTLFSRAFVATTPRVVEGGGGPTRPAWRGGTRAPDAATNAAPVRISSRDVPGSSDPPGRSRRPATIDPVRGSTTSPQAFTTARAPTTRAP